MVRIMRKQILLVFGGILITVFIVAGTLDIRNNKRNIELRNLEIKSQEAKLIELNQKYNEVIHLKTKTEKEKQQQLEKIKQLETERERLERELQAKLDKQSAKKEKLARSAQNASGLKSVSASGSKKDWLEASGIPSKYWSAVNSIVSGESGWNPSAVNKSSGACGLGQQLPCGKWAGAWNDPVAALKAMNVYVNKYDGWYGAEAFRNCTGSCTNPKTGQVVYKDHTWY